MLATERLYLTADQKRLVREGDPEAAFLYCTPGDLIPDEAAARFGLKAAERAEDKAAERAEDKAKGGRRAQFGGAR